MQLLIYGNRKEEPTYYDISTPEKELAAFLVVFRELDNFWQVYDDLPGKQKELYEKAKTGDGAAAKRLMEMRKRNEYEDFQIAEVVDPLNPLIV
jgi:hypothetical protein